jgi:uncharacterized protein with HEPN domain
MWRDEALLLDIVISARAALQITDPLTQEQFALDRTVRSATLYHLILMGEAASRISSECRDAHPDLPWREMVGLRNRLIHGYSETRLDIVWRTIREDLPPAIATLERLVPDEGSAPE